MPAIVLVRDPLMIVFRPPILEAVAGVGLLALSLAQAVTETVPAPVGNWVTTLLTGLGVGGVVSWGLKQIVTAMLKRQEQERTEEREDVLRLVEDAKEAQKRELDTLREQIALLRDEVKYWRDAYLERQDGAS